MSTILNPSFIPFQYSHIVTARHDGEILVSADAAADTIGLRGHHFDWSWRRDERWIYSYVTDHGIKSETFISMSTFINWLYAIKDGYIRDEAVKRRLAVYRNKAYEIIFHFWNGSEELRKQLVQTEKDCAGLRKELARAKNDLEEWKACCKSLRTAMGVSA